ncbi:hypothetical protein MtrunA17_Chr2g0299611 [Medicago truncatula]|uniref:Transmembrane protein, putative n=1 Tax=Medicago truncatula TaxID=3880 RepID=G7IQ62_MEDTR|nr:transmembrane protein, putative [Medicago truncatula]RHN73541.1 hypothetical protein MtrunA17_Chr2g0299611 [Medicago truncatula]
MMNDLPDWVQKLLVLALAQPIIWLVEHSALGDATPEWIKIISVTVIPIIFLYIGLALKQVLDPKIAKNIIRLVLLITLPFLALQGLSLLTLPYPGVVNHVPERILKPIRPHLEYMKALKEMERAAKKP